MGFQFLNSRCNYPFRKKDVALLARQLILMLPVLLLESSDYLKYFLNHFTVSCSDLHLSLSPLKFPENKIEIFP